MVKKPKITARKYMGDDLGSWAIFVDGQPVVTGLFKPEVAYYKKEVETMIKEKMEKE